MAKGSELEVLPYLAYAQMRVESGRGGPSPTSGSSPAVSEGPLSKDMALAMGLPSGNVDILRHRSLQRDAMPDWKLFQLFDVPPDPKNFKARLSYTRMDRRQCAHMNALHRLVYGKTADECGRKVCKEFARAYAIEVSFPESAVMAMRLDWAQFAVDKRGRKWHRSAVSHHLPPPGGPGAEDGGGGGGGAARDPATRHHSLHLLRVDERVSAQQPAAAATWQQHARPPAPGRPPGHFPPDDTLSLGLVIPSAKRSRPRTAPTRTPAQASQPAAATAAKDQAVDWMSRPQAGNSQLGCNLKVKQAERERDSEGVSSELTLKLALDSGSREWKLQNAKRLLGYESAKTSCMPTSSSDSDQDIAQGFSLSTSTSGTTDAQCHEILPRPSRSNLVGGFISTGILKARE